MTDTWKSSEPFEGTGDLPLPPYIFIRLGSHIEMVLGRAQVKTCKAFLDLELKTILEHGSGYRVWAKIDEVKPEVSRYLSEGGFGVLETGIPSYVAFLDAFIESFTSALFRRHLFILDYRFALRGTGNAKTFIETGSLYTPKLSPKQIQEIEDEVRHICFGEAGRLVASSFLRHAKKTLSTLGGSSTREIYVAKIDEEMRWTHSQPRCVVNFLRCFGIVRFDARSNTVCFPEFGQKCVARSEETKSSPVSRSESVKEIQSEPIGTASKVLPLSERMLSILRDAHKPLMFNEWYAMTRAAFPDDDVNLGQLLQVIDKYCEVLDSGQGEYTWYDYSTIACQMVKQIEARMLLHMSHYGVPAISIHRFYECNQAELAKHGIPSRKSLYGLLQISSTGRLVYSGFPKVALPDAYNGPDVFTEVMRSYFFRGRRRTMRDIRIFIGYILCAGEQHVQLPRLIGYGDGLYNLEADNGSRVKSYPEIEHSILSEYLDESKLADFTCIEWGRESAEYENIEHPLPMVPGETVKSGPIDEQIVSREIPQKLRTVKGVCKFDPTQKDDSKGPVGLSNKSISNDDISVFRRELMKSFSNGVSFKKTSIRLIECASGRSLTPAIRRQLEREMFQRSEDVWLLTEMVTDETTIAQLAKCADDFLSKFQGFSLIVLWRDFESRLKNLPDGEKDFANFFVHSIVPRLKHKIQFSGRKTNQFCFLASKTEVQVIDFLSRQLLSILNDARDAVPMTTILEKIPVLIRANIDQIIERTIPSAIVIEHDSLEYLTMFEFLALPDDIADKVTDVIDNIVDSGRSPSITLISKGLDDIYGVDLCESCGLDKALLQKIVSRVYHGKSTRIWRHHVFQLGSEDIHDVNIVDEFLLTTTGIFDESNFFDYAMKTRGLTDRAMLICSFLRRKCIRLDRNQWISTTTFSNCVDLSMEGVLTIGRRLRERLGDQPFLSLGTLPQSFFDSLPTILLNGNPCQWNGYFLTSYCCQCLSWLRIVNDEVSPYSITSMLLPDNAEIKVDIVEYVMDTYQKLGMTARTADDVFDYLKGNLVRIGRTKKLLGRIRSKFGVD